MNLEWSPLALERVSEIASYIALDKPSAAETWVDGLFESVGRLKSHPMSGRKVPEVGIERIREIVYGAYRVIYALMNALKKFLYLRFAEAVKCFGRKSSNWKAHNNSLQTDLYTAWPFMQYASLILLHKSPLRYEAAELRRYEPVRGL